LLSLLGIMHRDVRIAKYLFRCAVLRIARGDSDIYIYRDLVPVERERRGNTSMDLAGHFLGLSCRRQVAEYYRELISADAGDSVGVIHHPFKTFRGDRKDLVADRVPERVIDIFEAADVEEKHLKVRRRIVFI